MLMFYLDIECCAQRSSVLQNRTPELFSQQPYDLSKEQYATASNMITNGGLRSEMRLNYDLSENSLVMGFVIRVLVLIPLLGIVFFGPKLFSVLFGVGSGSQIALFAAAIVAVAYIAIIGRSIWWD